MKYVQTVKAILQTLEDEALATDDEGAYVDESKAAAWAKAKRAFNALLAPLAE
jgi:hypothetical protein